MSRLNDLAVCYDYLTPQEKYAFLTETMKNLGVLGQRMDDGTDMDQNDLDSAIMAFFELVREDEE
jgi:hypothetical protein